MAVLELEVGPGRCSSLKKGALTLKCAGQKKYQYQQGCWKNVASRCIRTYDTSVLAPCVF